MGRRIRSSIGVVIAGVIPIVLGGPVFAALLAVIVFVSWSEFTRMAQQLTPVEIPNPGLVGSLALVVVGWLNWSPVVVVGILFLTVASTFVAIFPRANDAGALVAATVTIAGLLYLGLPGYLAMSLRGFPGISDQAWLSRLATPSSIFGDPTPVGLGWVLVVVFATWVGDSSAFLVGRSWGRRRLAPAISPGKTWEGAIGGLSGSIIVSAIAIPALGLSYSLMVSVGVGLLVGIGGQLGDLSESFIKRQTGVKDSGALIPGHGGMLDRVDALWFALPAGWIIANLLGR